MNPEDEYTVNAELIVSRCLLQSSIGLWSSHWGCATGPNLKISLYEHAPSTYMTMEGHFGAMICIILVAVTVYCHPRF